MKPSEIKDLRKRLGWSADRLGEALGFHGKHRALTIWRYERGERTPSGAVMILLEQLKEGKS